AFKALSEAKEKGIIGHIGATAHNADCLKKLVEEYSDKIETLMFPYNIIENQGEEVLVKARSLGIATIAMKPLAGGNIDDYELALHYIMASPAIDIAIPGMGDPAEVSKNALAGESFKGFSEADKAEAKKIAEKLGTTFAEDAATALHAPWE
ncbi:MAG: aldo/keto reductase, partial [Oscillospiraceae bacterium]